MGGVASFFLTSKDGRKPLKEATIKAFLPSDMAGLYVIYSIFYQKKIGQFKYLGQISVWISSRPKAFFFVFFIVKTGRLKRSQFSFLFLSKVSFFGLCSKMQIIPIKNLNIKKVVPQFLWFFRLKCWFKGQIISRIHLSLPNAYKLMCFDRNINGNMDVKFLGCDYLLVQWWVKLTLVFKEIMIKKLNKSSLILS